MIRRGDAEQDRSRSLSAALLGRDTPREIVDRLHGEMQAVMAAPEMQQKILAIGLIPHESPSVEGIQRYIKAETQKWGTLVRQLGLEGSQ
jgi:tripartite-type tricarboxylate transporter receptor subunit TctC